MEPYIVEALNVVLSDREMNWETVLKEPTLEYEVSGKSKGRITIPVPTKYAYFYVDAAADEYVVLGISCDSKYKLWINQKFNGISPESNSIMVGMVQKGKNTVFFEFLEPISDLSFSCRVSGASYEIQPYPDRLLHRNLYIEHARLSLNVKSVTWGAISRIQFLLALNNHWNIDAKQKIKIQINSYWQDAILSETQGMFNRICSMPFPYDQERNVYTLKVTYKLLDGTEHTKDFYFYSPNLHIHRDETINAILSFVEASSCTSYTRMAFDYLLSSYRAMPTDDSMAQLLKYFDYACEYGALDSLIFRHGSIDRFFTSRLDGKIDKYHVSVPKNYDSKKKYALYITVATYRYGQDSDILCQCDNENVIWADVSCRGYTLGSYIGEAAVIEAINDMRETYSIDSSRIYLSGSSNGASCAWVLAKSYPHLFAGIKAVSGHVEINDLNNVNNMRVINISSQYENMYSASFEKPQTILKRSKNYSGYLAKAMNHSDLMKIRFQKDLTEDLLTYSINPWPVQIEFTSTRYMHNRCYWISIHQALEMNIKAEIKAKILDAQTIEIAEENVVTFEVILPSVIERKRFAIVINQKRYVFEKYKFSNIIFTKRKENFVACEEVPENQSRRGVGMLNVFLHPVQIYCDTKNFLAKKVAQVFSSPCGNGYDPRIYVEYPILDISTFDCKDRIYTGIVIDNNLSFPLFEKIRQNATVCTDEHGFAYQNKHYDGSYAVIQLIKGDVAEKDLLYINTNDIKLYQKILFFRKFIMPTYINGFHPYLNNDALIYCNGQYYGIETFGSPLKLICENMGHCKLSEAVSLRTFSPKKFVFSNELEFQNHWILCESANQTTDDYLIKGGAFIPLSGKYAYLSDKINLNNAPYTITATIRAFDRVGVAVEMGNDGKGYAILFLSENGQTFVDFINDDCVWGKHPHVNGRVLDYNWTEGKWYRVKLEASVSDDELRAKIWPENEAEPLYWMFVAELERMAAISIYGTKFVRKGKPGLRFALSDKILPQFKDILISPQEGT